MTVMAVLEVVSVLITFVLGWFSLPAFDQASIDTVQTFIIDLIGNGASVISLFVHKQFWGVALGILIFLVIADKLWALLWWIIRKIPFIGIE